MSVHIVSTDVRSSRNMEVSRIVVELVCEENETQAVIEDIRRRYSGVSFATVEQIEQNRDSVDDDIDALMNMEATRDMARAARITPRVNLSRGVPPDDDVVDVPSDDIIMDDDNGGDAEVTDLSRPRDVIPRQTRGVVRGLHGGSVLSGPTLSARPRRSGRVEIVNGALRPVEELDEDAEPARTEVRNLRRTPPRPPRPLPPQHSLNIDIP